MLRMRSIVLATALAMGFSACASAPASEPVNQYVISRAELAQLAATSATALTARDAIVQLRPGWLRNRRVRGRGSRLSYAFPTVYVNGVQGGNLDAYCGDQLESAEYRPPGDPRIGSSFTGGIVAVRTVPEAQRGQRC
jgi:hypothetical protein